MSVESFLSKLEKNNTRKFTLPTLQEEVTYKRMDVVESSINHSLPNFLASRVLETMKKSINGVEDTPTVPDISDQDLTDLLVRATEMWRKLVVEPKLPDDKIVEIPATDRLAWFLNAVAESHESDTVGGGKINAAEAANFPNKRGNKRNSERSSDSEVL